MAMSDMPSGFRIFSRNRARAPQYLGPKSKVSNSLISEGCRIYGTVINSVISGGVIIEEGAIVRDSVIMEDVVIRTGAEVNKSIIDAECIIDCGATVGDENATKADIVIVGKGKTISNTAGGKCNG